jgi:hypothetical protein
VEPKNKCCQLHIKLNCYPILGKAFVVKFHSSQNLAETVNSKLGITLFTPEVQVKGSISHSWWPFGGPLLYCTKIERSLALKLWSVIPYCWHLCFSRKIATCTSLSSRIRYSCTDILVVITWRKLLGKQRNESGILGVHGDKQHLTSFIPDTFNLTECMISRCTWHCG